MDARNAGTIQSPDVSTTTTAVNRARFASIELKRGNQGGAGDKQSQAAWARPVIPPSTDKGNVSVTSDGGRPSAPRAVQYPPARAASRQQPGYVRASDQQHERNRALKNQKRVRSRQRLPEKSRAASPVLRSALATATRSSISAGLTATPF